MPYRLNVSEEIARRTSYVDAAGKTECAVFIQQACGAPQTSLWSKGILVKGAPAGSIPRGTAIATFDAAGRYPTDNQGKHAAVYLSHDEHEIRVLDQWNGSGGVKPRGIRFGRPSESRSNNGDTFFVIT